MSAMRAMIPIVQMHVTRPLSPTDSDAQAGLAGVRTLGLSVEVTEGAVREGCDATTVRAQLEGGIVEMGLTIRDDAPTTLTVSVDALDMSGPVATSRLQMAVDVFKYYLASQARTATVAWHGYELGIGKGDTFAKGASGALTALLERVAKDLRAANSTHERG